MSLLQALKLSPLPQRNSKPAFDPSASAPKTPASPDKTARLGEAAQTWRMTHGTADERILALKKCVQSHFADGHPELLRSIEQGLARLDVVLDNVDHSLAEALDKAGAATNDAKRQAELAGAKSLVTEYINYIKGESLIAHIDANPFGVATDLKSLLITGLTKAAKAIG